MKLPPIKLLMQEDFPGVTWITKLLYPLNLFMTTVYSGFNNGLTRADNMIAMFKTITIAGSTPTTSFQWPFQTNPVSCTIAKITKSDGTNVVFTSAVYASWSYSAGVISITNITGLDSSTTYSVTFEAHGG